MRVLWHRQRATVGDVVEAIGALGDASTPAYNTVLTVLKILERKGYVAHEKDGRAFAYRPLIDGAQARRRALSHLLTRFFEGSRELLVQDLLGHERPDDEQRERIRDLIARAADEGAADAKAHRVPETPSTKRGRQ